MDEQLQKDVLKSQTIEKENRMNLKALVEEFNSLNLKYHALKKESDETKKQMEMLNNNFAQVLQRVNIIAAQKLGSGPTS